MFFSKKKDYKSITFDRETMIPAIKASICTGEQVVGFMDVATGRFTDVSLVKSSGDIEAFKKRYGIDCELEKIY